MALLQQAPKLTAADASEIARELYGIDALATVLPSERDQNFLLGPSKLGPYASSSFVLKISNAADDRALLDAQAAAAAHLAARGAASFHIVPTTGGEALAVLPPRFGGRHFVRLVTWLPGVTMASVPQHSPALFGDLGRHLGEIDRALGTFDHPALHRDFYWDLAKGLSIVRERMALVQDESLKSVIAAAAARIEREDAPRFKKLRRSVIHNDANDHNIVVDQAGERVVGLIDFGDMVRSFTVADLAIAIAYAVLDRPDPLSTAAAIVHGYHSTYPLLADEISVLPGLVVLRLCVSACVAADQQRQRPNDEYITISQAAIRRTLPKLAALSSSDWHIIADKDPLLTNTLDERRRVIGPNVRLSYREPLKIVRGSMQYLYDDEGRQYLDAYNNVPHVGHSHPRVVEAAAEQMRVLNTNTRYLHDNLIRYAERLVLTLPDPLRVCYFVNSGSEANELALRLARAHTRQRGLIVLDAAYHGNTTTLVSISPYKFNGPGGEGRPSWVRTVPIPDVYRGPFKNDDARAGEKYAKCVGAAIDELRGGGDGLCGYIAESAPSVGGQIIFPPGYLDAVYGAVRAAGGVCIADEVQTAFGRLGSSFYAFEAQRVVPDIVVLGKPIGNGHPLGAVVTTREIAASFDNGMEFFSTFGGNTVSCAVGIAVLDVVEGEGLQEHARRVGEDLSGRLRGLIDRHAIVGDVRGSGLFLGVELVRDRATLEPAAKEASLVVNRLREEGILIGTDGPHANVLKIRPPMPFNEADAELLAETLDRVLSELDRSAGRQP
jgi:4-aminobutyrate aminotransferase-like enzyme/Ser/Thr protein kinase RdoA (MazF antagonist)